MKPSKLMNLASAQLSLFGACPAARSHTTLASSCAHAEVNCSARGHDWDAQVPDFRNQLASELDRA
eukprot:6812841-Pyramimonas_sp.AAC.1